MSSTESTTKATTATTMSSTSTTSAAVDPAATAAASLEETLQKISASLLPAVDELLVVETRSSSSSSTTTKKPPPPQQQGLDFLHAKNTLLLSYIIDWMVELRESSASSDDEEEDADSEEDGDTPSPTTTQAEHDRDIRKQRLLEMRTVLEKTRGLDKKLRYQIDKLLASAAASNSGSFVTHHNDEDDVPHNFAPSAPEDPLQFRPDPKSFMDDEEGEESDEEDGNRPQDDSNAEDDSDDDEDLKAARQALAASTQTKQHKKSKKQDSGDDDDNTAGVYRAPRLTAVPYTHDISEKNKEQEKRRLRKLRASELALTLKDQFGDAPEQEGVHGNATDLYGQQRALERRLKNHQKEKEDFEMANMMRLQTSRQEKKDRKLLERMMQGGGDLAQMANLGNLVRETQEFGKNNSKEDPMDEYAAQQQALEEFHRTGGGQQRQNKQSSGSSRHANGKRRRDRGGDDFGGDSKRKSRMPAAKNSLQAELYGKSGSSKNKSKKSKR